MFLSFFTFLSLAAAVHVTDSDGALSEHTVRLHMPVEPVSPTLELARAPPLAQVTELLGSGPAEPSGFTFGPHISVSSTRHQRAESLRREVELMANLKYEPFQNHDSPFPLPDFKLLHELRKSGSDPEVREIIASAEEAYERRAKKDRPEAARKARLEDAHRQQVAMLLATDSPGHGALTIEECLAANTSALEAFLARRSDIPSLGEKHMIRLAVYILKEQRARAADIRTHDNATRGLVTALGAYDIGAVPSAPRGKNAVGDGADRSQGLEKALDSVNLLAPGFLDNMKASILGFVTNILDDVQDLISKVHGILSNVNAIVDPIKQLLDVSADDNAQHDACRTLVSPFESVINAALDKCAGRFSNQHVCAPHRLESPTCGSSSRTRPPLPRGASAPRHRACAPQPEDQV